MSRWAPTDGDLRQIDGDLMRGSLLAHGWSQGKHPREMVYHHPPPAMIEESHLALPGAPRREYHRGYTTDAYIALNLIGEVHDLRGDELWAVVRSLQKPPEGVVRSLQKPPEGDDGSA